jgi:hypothetical protein
VCRCSSCICLTMMQVAAVAFGLWSSRVAPQHPHKHWALVSRQGVQAECPHLQQYTEPH